LKSNQPSKLLQLIKSNPQIKAQLLSIVTDNIHKLFPNAYDVSFNTDRTGTNIEIKFNTQDSIYYAKLVPKGQLGIFANIASNINTIEGVNDYCRTNIELNELCRDPKFWTEMIRTRFPEYLLPAARDYKQKRLYKCLLRFQELKDKYQPLIDEFERLSKIRPRGYIGWTRDQNIHYGKLIDQTHGQPWRTLSKEYPEALKYLILNNLVELSKEDIEKLTHELDSYDVDLFKYILKKYPKKSEDLHDLLSVHFHHLPIIKLLLSGEIKDDKGGIFNIDYEDVKEAIQDMFDSSLGHDEYIYPLDEFKFYYELLDDSYTVDSLINFLLQGYEVNPETLKYILSMLPDTISSGNLFEYLKEATRGIRPQIVGALMNKYGKLLSVEDKQELIDEIEAEHSSYPQNRDELLAFFQ